MKYSTSIPALLCLFISGVGFAETKPNILLIVSEDNGPELGCYGDRFARTPHLDQLAEDGILFRQAFVPQAGCSQSRASFLTGLYPHQHGQFGLATWGFRMYRADTPNLPRSLKEVGYRTGIIGKLHINPASAFPFDMHEITSANFQRTQLSDYAKHAKEFMGAGKDPFFLSVNYPDAHRPWIAQVDGLPKNPQTKDDVKVMDYMGIDSPEFREMVADHYNCMSRLDSLIGDLLTAGDAPDFRYRFLENVKTTTLLHVTPETGTFNLHGYLTYFNRKTRVASVGAGIRFWGDVQHQTHLLKLGANMLIHSGDNSLFQKHLQLEMAAIKTAIGLAREDTASSAPVI